MKKTLIISASVLVLGITLVAVLLLLRKPSVVPQSILKQIDFAIFYPPVSQQTTIETGTFKYAKSLGQVSFIVEFGGQHITFAEQASPDSFGADPNFYSQFIKSLNGYTFFDSVNGRVDLAQPAQVNAETGVMNAKGTLMFAKSDGNLSEDNWKLLFNSLSYTQPN